MYKLWLVELQYIYMVNQLPHVAASYSYEV